MKKEVRLYDRVQRMEYPQLAGNEKGYAVRSFLPDHLGSSAPVICHALRDKLKPAFLHALSEELDGARISDALRRKSSQVSFASAFRLYKLYVPSVAELRAEIKREVRALETDAQGGGQA
ncbi:MAG: hypothetical protein NT011_08820 [Kiritimatiellaeota bacterium]|nr:hypothetical protein [Kiritimatiellota bacterium]